MINNKLIAAIGMSAFALCGTAAQAETQTGYFGGNIAFLEYSEDLISDDASLTAIYGRVGMNLNANFSGEIRVGVGLGDDSVDVLGTEVDVELDKMFGVYLRGGIPVAEGVFPYAIIGYTNGEVTASASGFGSESESESDVSFGVGIDFALNDELTLNAEYMSYFDKDGAEIGGFALGIVTKF
jgi:opacity protein-like surface antigen